MVGRVNCSLMGQCEGGDLRVGNEIAARGGCLFEQFQNPLDVGRIWVQYASYPTAKPAPNLSRRFHKTHWPKIRAGVCADADERKDDRVGQADWLASREARLPPRTGSIVKRGSTVVSI